MKDNVVHFNGNGSPSDPEAVAERVKAAMTAQGLSQRTVADQAGLNSGRLSAFLNGKYAGDAAGTAERLTDWLADNDRHLQAASEVPGIAEHFVETAVTHRIFSTLHQAKSWPDFVVIKGSPGIGKTRALERFAETTPNAWLCTMSQDIRSVTATLEEIAIAIGIREPQSGAIRLRRQIVSKLHNTKGLLMVDEAQFLSDWGLETVRSAIVDRAKVGLALVGDDKLYERIDRFPQVTSRCGQRVALGKVRSADVGKIAGHLGITDEAATGYLASIATLPGGLRNVIKTIRLASLGAGLTEKNLQAAWSNRKRRPAATLAGRCRSARIVASRQGGSRSWSRFPIICGTVVLVRCPSRAARSRHSLDVRGDGLDAGLRPRRLGSSRNPGLAPPASPKLRAGIMFTPTSCTRGGTNSRTRTARPAKLNSLVAIVP